MEQEKLKQPTSEHRIFGALTRGRARSQLGESPAVGSCPRPYPAAARSTRRTPADGRGGVGGCTAPLRLGGGSLGRTAASLVAVDVRRVTQWRLRGESEGEREVTMVLSQEVTNEMPPGEYRCEGVPVYDVHLNRKTFHPDIRFRVENIPGDHEGPELFGWRVSKE
jgi:hypothetical protein